ncbi:hypothetical protein B5F77_05590 [Parabacteroides sp. An277]|nr:hypothetical protein B5F77_05590 [Parabacteroides sp. An277]
MRKYFRQKKSPFAPFARISALKILLSQRSPGIPFKNDSLRSFRRHFRQPAIPGEAFGSYLFPVG